MRLDEMWGMSGLREDVLSYGSGLRENVLSYGSGLSEDVLSDGPGLRENVISYGSGLSEDVLSDGQGLRENVIYYGSGLHKDPGHVLPYETLSSMDLVRTFFNLLVTLIKDENWNGGIKQEIINKKDTNKE